MYLRTNKYVDNAYFVYVQNICLHIVTFTLFMHCDIFISCAQNVDKSFITIWPNLENPCLVENTGFFEKYNFEKISF